MGVLFDVLVSLENAPCVVIKDRRLEAAATIRPSLRNLAIVAQHRRANLQ